MWLLSHVYSYSVNQLLYRFSEALYSLWISNFIGEVGEKTSFARPLLLQGGGQRRIKIGSYTSIGHHSILGCWMQYANEKYEPEIVIGNNCCIGEYCHITAINKIIIGDGLLTGRYVYIGDNSHGGLSIEEAQISPLSRKLVSKGGIVIGKNVWLGDKVTILPNVHIGDNVIVAANSVVTKDVVSNSVVAGVPAKVIKQM